MSLSMRGFQRRKLLGDFEEKQKLVQLCWSQSNLDSDGSKCSGQELMEGVGMMSHSVSLTSSPHALKC